jgi:putative membrane protein
MKKWMQLPLALAMVVTLACDRGDNTTGNAGTVGTTGAASDVDRDFVEDQLAGGHAEVELGRLAQERASNAEVREFAGMMVRDHQKAGDELKQIASRHNVRAEDAMHDDHNDLRERLSTLSGNEFDREYIDAMVADHQKAVDAVDGKADSDNADVKQWAASTLPTLKQHLERAKQIQANLRSTDTRSR